MLAKAMRVTNFSPTEGANACQKADNGRYYTTDDELLNPETRDLDLAGARAAKSEVTNRA
jgi:hypothetical protein